MAGKSREWQYAVGDYVDHMEGGMRSIVTRRVHLRLGIYDVRAVSLDDPQRDRMIYGSALVASPQAKAQSSQSNAQGFEHSP